MKKQQGFSRITFLILLGVFIAGTATLTKYAHAMGGGGQDVPCSSKKAGKWCAEHGKKDMCFRKKEAYKPGGMKKGMCDACGMKKGKCGCGMKAAHAGKQLRDVADVELSSLVRSGKPLVVKFHAIWCSVCIAMKPIDIKMAASNPSVTLVQIDFEKYKNLAKDYKVVGFPTYVFFKDGKQQAMYAGKMSERDFTSKVEQLLK